MTKKSPKKVEVQRGDLIIVKWHDSYSDTRNWLPVRGSMNEDTGIPVFSCGWYIGECQGYIGLAMCHHAQKDNQTSTTIGGFWNIPAKCIEDIQIVVGASADIASPDG